MVIFNLGPNHVGFRLYSFSYQARPSSSKKKKKKGLDRLIRFIFPVIFEELDFCT